MNVYIISKFENYEAVRALAQRIRNAGHTVTDDWTLSDQFGEDGHPVSYNDSASSEVQTNRALAECDAIEAADVVLVLAQPGLHNSLVEIGIAVGMDKRLVVVNAEQCWTIFFRLLDVWLFDTDVDALAALGVVLPAEC